jgi:hypothetical protein
MKKFSIIRAILRLIILLVVLIGIIITFDAPIWVNCAIGVILALFGDELLKSIKFLRK